LSIESAGVDCALDTTGIPFCIKSALGALKKGGKAPGLAVTGRMEMDAWTDLFRRKKLDARDRGGLRSAGVHPQADSHVQSGHFPV
jgi:threonine dehydrogenase-like Zn-dependent dehydrogenase